MTNTEQPMSTVRRNLLSEPGYAPYCGGSYAVCGLPRTMFDGEQFKCPRCSFRSNFEPEFISEVVAFNALSKAGAP